MIYKNMDDAKKKNSSTCASKEKMQNPLDTMVKETLSQIKHKLFVMSGKGGVGKSSVAANIAVGLAQKGFKVGLIDVDLHGPSIAKIMGMKGLLNATEDKKLIPKDCIFGLKVVSMQSLMQEKDQAIIWRGPAKTGMIKQFIGSVKWGQLDYLVIDAPPGTGDEPITIAQTIHDAKAVIVTTPQDVATDDVRKSVSFCKTVKMEIAGIIENMSGFECPHCGKQIDLFKTGGGKKMAEEVNVNFLGSIPFDTNVVNACDDGKPIISDNQNSAFSKAILSVIDKIV